MRVSKVSVLYIYIYRLMEGQNLMSKKLEAAVRGIVTRVMLKYQPSSYGPLTPTLGSRESGQGPRRVEHLN